MTNPVPRFQVAIYFLLSLIIPISAFMIVAFGLVDKKSGGAQAAEIVAKYGPSLAGLIVALMAGGLAALGRLAKRALVWNVHIRWYFLALGLPLILDDLLPLGLYSVMGGTATIKWTYTISSAYLFAPILFRYLFLGGGMGEEFGWRGYLTSHLQRRYSPLKTALVVGVLWAAWHFPTFWLGHHSGVELAYMHLEKIVRACALAVVFSWVFNNSRGSVLLVALMHAATNAFGHTYELVTQSASPAFFSDQRILDLLAIACWTAFAVILAVRRKLETTVAP